MIKGGKMFVQVPSGVSTTLKIAGAFTAKALEG